MIEYRITRLKDGKTFKTIQPNDKKAEAVIGAFIRESEVKSMWKVTTIYSRRKIATRVLPFERNPNEIMLQTAPL